MKNPKKRLHVTATWQIETGKLRLIQICVALLDPDVIPQYQPIEIPAINPSGSQQLDFDVTSRGEEICQFNCCMMNCVQPP